MNSESKRICSMWSFDDDELASLTLNQSEDESEGSEDLIQVCSAPSTGCASLVERLLQVDADPSHDFHAKRLLQESLQGLVEILETKPQHGQVAAMKSLFAQLSNENQAPEELLRLKAEQERQRNIDLFFSCLSNGSPHNLQMEDLLKLKMKQKGKKHYPWGCLLCGKTYKNWNGQPAKDHLKACIDNIRDNDSLKKELLRLWEHMK